MLPKRIIFQSVVRLGPFMEDLDNLDLWLNEMASSENWCPDWEYTLSSTFDLGEYDLKVFGEIETNE